MPHLSFLRHTVLLLLAAMPATLCAQQPTWQEFVEDYAADMQNDETTATRLEQQLDELEQLHRNPLNLNEASREQLARITFLSKRQLDDLVLYLSKHRPLLHLGEMELVRSFDDRTRRWLSLFVMVAPVQTARKATFLSSLVGGRHEVLARVGIPFYRREGFKQNSSLSRSARYLGDRNSARFRYQYSSADTLRYGFTADKDAGEPMACRGNALFDSYSLYVAYSPTHRKLQFVLGDYYVHFGEGLIMGGNALFSSLANYQPRPQRAIKPHTSASECDFLRGAAVLWRVGSMELTAFGSLTQPDAIVRGDSAITSLPTSGLHRTEREMKYRRSATRLTGGADITFRGEQVALGASFMATRLNKPLAPANRLYNRYALRGRSTTAVGLHGLWNGRSVALQGELALSQGGGHAHIVSLNWQPRYNWRLIAAERFYAMRYHAPFGRSLSAGSGVQNERGAYLATHYAPMRSLMLDGFVDWSYRPWPTYTYSSASHGLACRAGATYSFGGGNLQGYWQYCNNTYREEGRSLQHERHSARIAWVRKWRLLNFTAEGRYVSAQSEGNKHQGWATALRWNVRPEKELQMSGLVAYFDAPHYSARIYQYEPNVPYGATSLSLYGRGMRLSLMAKGLLGHWGELSARYGLTRKFDHKGFSSGADRINRNTKQDVVLQARIFF